MKRHSLQFRLLSAGSVALLGALILAGIGLVKLFGLHLERRVEAELHIYLNQLLDRIEIVDGRVHLSEQLADPRFALPLSGLYWQVQDDDRPTLLRSRSLWDNSLNLAIDQLSQGEVHQHTIRGPADQEIMVLERRIILSASTSPHHLRIAVARDTDDLQAASHAFATDMLPYFALLALFLIAASWFQVRTGLSPLEKLRRDVMAIRSGKAQRLQGNYLDEITPLVDEIDELLEARDAMVEKARTWTGDLAHGLKTPLSVLSADAQRLREAGQTEIADDLEQLALTMRQRVDRELIRARLRSAGPAQGPKQTDIVDVTHRVLNILQRTCQNPDLNWSADLPDSAIVNMGSEDLMEMLGNLLDNASKWAERRIHVSISATGANIELKIEDDGPGVEASLRQQLGQRGLRLDQKTHGYGLGLAIVQDIADAYAASVEFPESSLGGFAICIRFAPLQA